MNKVFKIFNRQKKPPQITLLSPRTGPRARFDKFKKEQKYLALCFAVPALIMLIMYACWQVFPFGENSVLVLDLNGQYVYFFEGLRNIILNCKSPIYSFNRALGGEFMGIFAYYLSSPFSFIVCLFPKDMITEALFLMFLLKTGCCGLTFGIYIEATRKRNRVSTVMFSTMYALCAYAVVMQHNTMWTDNLILLPIIMLGIENMIKYGKFKMFVISLSMAVFSNFYIGYMMCIFAAAYFFYAYFSRTPEERNPLGERHHFLRSLGRMALFSAISVAICATIILCTYYSLKFGKTTFSNPNFTPDQKFDWLDLVTKLFIGSYDTVRPEGLPFIYCGTPVLILLPLYFIAPHIKVREKVASGILIAFFLVSFNITTVDLFWHGMQRPNWLNYRYSFMLCFIMVLLAYKAYEKLAEIGYRKALACCAVLGITVILLQKIYGDGENVRNFSTVWLTLAILAVYAGVLRAVTYSKFNIRRTGAMVMAILVGAEMFGGGMLSMSSLDSDVVYSSRTSYRTFIDKLTPTVENIKSNDSSFYRMEKTDHRKTNDNFSLDINGLSNSTSTLNSETISLLHDLGLSSKSHWSKYLGGTPVLDSLFGLKYIITESDSDEIMELYEQTALGKGSYTVYENPYALPIAFGVSRELEDLEIHETYVSPFERMNAVVASMLGREEVNIFTPVSHDGAITCSGMIRSAVSGHLKFEKTGSDTDSRIIFNITVPDDNVLYCCIPSKYLRECYLYINDVKHGSVFGNETDRIIELGRFNAGETVTVSLEPLESVVYMSNECMYFWQLDEAAFRRYMPDLQECAFEIEEFSDDHFVGQISVTDKYPLVFTSIPYDEGWKIYANGEQVETVKLLGGTVGFELEAGDYTLEMKYRPDCLYTGLGITSAGLVAFAAAWAADELSRKKRAAAGTPVYCEPSLETGLCPPVLSEDGETKDTCGTDCDTEEYTDGNDGRGSDAAVNDTEKINDPKESGEI